MTIIIYVNDNYNLCKLMKTNLHFITFCVDMFFKMVYYTTTNIQSCEQDMTLSKPGHREYQIW